MRGRQAVITRMRELVEEDAENGTEGGGMWMPLKSPEAAALLKVIDLLNEAERQVPGWAGANDEAHAWWVRVREAVARVSNSEGV
jgi:hypothetical protein